ncbi:MAG: hypothetical protein A2015_15900 [Spirochaetes bacterium GWF1_31_7]|nr:MAG: hypothetical protein A2Y30_13275 [Spirochaetes bacterium GWE1_32_154]OHD49937.1 MAG: hypothetical protein A2Y29_11320 [Spirochaetes bacterium GWE2_31_10]OHD52255.1 MAG: hypothetical protein A2015_15900 [Spirochaetes bacterium GWF1_31_7]OHD81019.1 MAG: hypothetical protein A2355_12540 [Spirochaetes bacterium RIFOXYB1_FULL_32_8]HBD92606.1 hypothetical protein [Spirochaetia bacterium]
MEYHSYYIVFPEGDAQQIRHPLDIGNIVDMNGNLYEDENRLHPKLIAYRVSGYSKKINFKEIDHYYRLAILNADEVTEELLYRTLEEKNRKEMLNKVYTNLEKKLRNKKWSLWK